MTDATPLVCERCGIFHPCHPDTAQDGGVRLVSDAESVLCVVCVDWLDVEGPTDLPTQTLAQRVTDAAQRTLGGFGT